MHVVWEKFCRYFDVEPRIVPLQAGKYTIGPEDVEPHVDENTIGVAAVVGTTFTGHADDVVGINDLLLELKEKKGLDVPLHIDGASGAFVWPFLYPDSEVGLSPRAGALDQRLRPQVRPRLSGDRLAHLQGEVRPRRGSRLLRELPRQDGCDVHPQLLHRLVDGPRPVLQLRSLRQVGLPQDHGDHAAKRRLARRRHRGDRQVSRSSARTRRRCRWSPSTSPTSTPTTSSTSPSSWPPSGVGCSPPTRCRRTPRT